MNLVPYYLNQILMYGKVLELNEEISELGVRVWISLQTRDGDHGHTILLRDRRALELLAFYDAHMQMLPHEPFTISVNGHVRSCPDEMQLRGDAVTFHVGPQVRMWGGKLVQAVLRKYAQQYGPRPWLGSEFDGEDGNDADRRSSTDSTANEADGKQRKRKSSRKRRTTAKVETDG